MPRDQFFKAPNSAYDVGVTDLRRPLRPPSMAASLDQFTNRNATSTISVQLVGGVSLRLLPRNLRRVGLQIQNIDITSDINYSLGNDLGAEGFKLAPGQFALYDFTTPPDELYLFCSANAQVVVMDVTRTAAPPKVAGE